MPNSKTQKPPRDSEGFATQKGCGFLFLRLFEAVLFLATVFVDWIAVVRVSSLKQSTNDPTSRIKTFVELATLKPRSLSPKVQPIPVSPGFDCIALTRP